MRAIVINKWVKSLDELTVDPSAPEPDASVKDSVIVRVRAVGANFFDKLSVRASQIQIGDIATHGDRSNRPSLSFQGPRWAPLCSSPVYLSCCLTAAIPQFAGDVIGVTPGTGDKYKVGDRVFGSTLGCYAERLVINIDKIFRIPEAMSYEEAAGLCITLPTRLSRSGRHPAHRAGFPREWCLVHAGAGGVGLAAVQIAKALGARVIATAGSSEKLDVAIRLGGADHALDYTDGRWTGNVMEITKGRGCDVVFDPVGLIETSMKCAAWSARLVVVGFAGGGGKFERVAMNRVLLKN
ncbi:MAG: hypothetical protein BJ554DRAFT_8353, partial [Olpidium bornovanus]